MSEVDARTVTGTDILHGLADLLDIGNEKNPSSIVITANQHRVFYETITAIPDHAANPYAADQQFFFRGIPLQVASTEGV